MAPRSPRLAPAPPDKPAKPYRVTSLDVAAAAGVSQSTVSRALAGDPVVSAATRTHVEAVAAQLNYHSNQNAVRLRTGKTGTLAVVVICRPDAHIKDVNPFYHALLGEICAAAARAGYETLVSFQGLAEPSPGRSARQSWGRYQEQRKADGLIAIGTSENVAAWRHIHALAEEGANVVCWGAPYAGLDGIRSDNHAGAALAVHHLYAGGYRRIVCIASQTAPQRQFGERYDGYAAAMRGLGLAPRLIAITPGFAREEQGRRAALDLLASPETFDAIFAVCDEIALGALCVLREGGVRVPEDVGLVGFDGIRAGAHASPPLTSIEPDFDQAGAMLVARLLAGMAGGASAPANPTRVPVRLLPRGSSRHEGG